MKLTEALRAINSAAGRAAQKQAYLACGFTPLHLQTFLTAHLQERTATERIAMRTGAFDDLTGNVEQMAGSGASLGVCIIEWADLDPRLGVRRAASWSHNDFADIEQHVRAALGRLTARLLAAAQSMRLVLCMPTLPLLPVGYTAPGRMSRLEANLRALAAEMAAQAAAEPRIAVVRADWGESGFDLESEIVHGFPYTMAHADAVAEAMARVGLAQPRKKGLITDLDDTLWMGIVGEIGMEQVAWDMEHHARVHGLYQQLLHWLAAEGVLIGVASKNNPAAVEQAFAERKDLLLRREDVFPFEVHWDAKSSSVGRILQKWNIAAEAAVFVDDSPLELAEVAAAHPGIETIRFPATAGEFLPFWRRLRELFAADHVGTEDAIRSRSLRENSRLQVALEETADKEAFLATLNAKLNLRFSTDTTDRRALELVNKTNQFNINGLRVDEASWAARLGQPGTFLVTCQYEDKFGPLGTIAVAQGELRNRGAVLHSWVMSCRAFSRFIEFAMLREMMRQFELDWLDLDYRETERNEPVRNFLQSIGNGMGTQVRIERTAFEAACPQMHHRIEKEIVLDATRMSDGGTVNA
jgi:FkbH-like protein